MIVDTVHPFQGDKVGFEVIEHDDLVVAAAPGDRVPGGCVGGIVQVYQRTEFGLEPFQRLPVSRPTVCNLWRQGWSMEVVGSFLFVGCPEADTPEFAGGLVEVYEKTADGYELFQTIYGVPGQGHTSLLGYSMVADGQDIWISMPGSDLTGTDTGAVARFAFESGAWVHKETVVAPSDPTDFTFLDLTVDQGRLIGTTDQAFCVVLKRDSTGAWVEVDRFFASSNQSPPMISAADGWLLSGDGDDDSVPLGNTGRVRCFRWDGSRYVMEWTIFPSMPTINPSGFFERFGYDLDVVPGRALIGAPYTYFGGVTTEGAAYVFELQNGTWTETERIERPVSTAPAGEPEGNDFGFAVHIGQDVDIVGMPFYFHSGEYAGGAFIYERAIGERVCAGQGNSTGAPALLELKGSRHVSANDLDANVTGVPPSTFALTVVSRGVGSTPLPGSAQSVLCVDTSTLVRLPVQQASPSGEASWSLDPQGTPSVTGAGYAPGDTIVVQTWYRDNVLGQSLANLSNAVSLTLR